MLESLIDSGNSAEDTEGWEQRTFGWTESIDEALKTATINSVLSGNDTLLLMSTGGGKSLCYQLPAVIAKGLTLVVSPLLSLIEDQLLHLKELGIEAATINANTSKEEVKRIEDAITRRDSTFRILYVTPEKLAKSKRFMNKLEKSNEIGYMKLIAIDEVHCCSQWGHDFRPDYKFLNVLKRQFKDVPILGLTATATAAVLDDVKKMLGIPAALVFRSSFNRPNLKYEVFPKTVDGVMVLAKLIKDRFDGQSGIVYCFSRKDTEETADSLRKSGLRAFCYHAYMEDHDRKTVHQRWVAGNVQIIVATVAFGMGIDKPDVRFVIHYTLPKSIENYYQESGRAGRDGQPATCILFWRIQDMFKQSTSVSAERGGVQNLYSVVDYATGASDCRRIALSSHFEEPWETDWCGKKCDICCGEQEAEEVDGYEILENAVAIMKKEKDNPKKSSNGKLTGKMLVDMLVRDNGQKQILIECVLARLLVLGYLAEDFHYTAYSVISYMEAGPKYKQLTAKTLPLKISKALPGTNSRKRPLAE
ncbi:unnamed protein product, partial [Mesorhabditis spiculigera]